MHFSRLQVSNYRSLREIDVPLSRFSTVIGENNSGKSSLLQTLLLLVKGPKLSQSDFYDPHREVMIKVSIQEISDADLEALSPEHRGRVRSISFGGTLCLVRRYKTDGTSSLRCERLLPLEERFRPDSVASLIKGLSGTNLRNKVEEVFPELKGKLSTITQTGIKDQIDEYVASMPVEQLTNCESDLPTGIDNSIKALLPEPIYIPAVKDLTDEVKTRDSASFGKILSVLLNVIGPKLAEVQSTFAVLNEKLNRVEQEGQVVDKRLDEIKEIERTIEGYVQENFRSVSLEIQIPPPEIKTVLSASRIVVNDGVEGPVESKGDGLKRGVLFAILRAYVTLQAKPEWQKTQPTSSVSPEHFLFLYEEPELYLHPTAQMILFDALRQIAASHQVVLSTHSPMFLTPQAEGTFIKMAKSTNGQGKDAPFSKPLYVDLEDVATKDQFQLICFENNNVAFFADTVVLVEGDSDLICFSHIAKTLNPDWDFGRTKAALVRANGKGSIARYRTFFERFNVRTYVITDLDIIVKDFNKLGLPEKLADKRAALLRLVDSLLPKGDTYGSLKGQQIRNLVGQRSWKKDWAQFKEIAGLVRNGKAPTEMDIALIDSLFDVEKCQPRLTILKNHPQVEDIKRELISEAREHGVFILHKGCIDDYYPENIQGEDKPSKAQHFCKCVTSGDAVNELCDKIPMGDGQQTVPEFRLICSSIFSGSDDHAELPSPTALLEVSS